jgi:hypothetical protein
MKKLLVLLLLPIFSYSQIDIKKTFKFSTFYAAVNGGTSISDVETYSVTDGLGIETIQTPYDYNLTLGIRKIARFGYENRANTFYDGTESNYSDAATIGKRNGTEFLFQVDYKRQEGVEYLDQHHFIRYVANDWIAKAEYLVDGFADIEYFETSQRYRYDVGKISFNVGAVQRLSEPYGYDPLASWRLDNGNIHYTYLALQEGYNVDVYHDMYYNPDGDVVAFSSDVWEQIVIPEVLANYVERKRNELDNKLQHSLVVGLDYYYYNKSIWIHTWANLMPYHYNDKDEFSYHNYIDGQWLDYSGGLIFGQKINKRLGVFAEGKYNKYWNREWYDFKMGINYIIR